MFPQGCNVPFIQTTFREHVKGNFFQKILDEKVVFALKVHDMTITNVDLLANSSNHKAIFPEYSKNIPHVCFKNIPRISLEYCNAMKMILWNQKVQKIVLWVIL